ncbi:phage Gp37/Gp68 family protein [Cuneatibacter sp. NSJ-177]|uniref:DUF5131 family protein n=1 Tax=Cuneatibacter sp. NSJ-177 TaxID=2931401 RepID=UPI001FCFAE0C|nr:DUF5131 family protein [Cuneatibacter sp. NSJ-177]MCJ7837461.1 phage Gp37/Gp68 family protein [Cuneatibacter sp. NSJ-177]
MDKTKIDWCDSTWNPVTGCLHGCEYCYARGIANRFGFHASEPDINERVLLEMPMSAGKKVPYPFDFQPTFHRYRLDEYRNKRGRNIFVCSMADLFGEWVPDTWIEEVFETCKKSPQHNYLFLTKNPGRYEKLLNCYMPPNMWFGWSQTGPVGADFSFTTHHSVQTFVSMEPLLSPFTEFHIRGVDWVIIGAETGRRKDKVVPKREWIEDIVGQCRKEDIPVFMKSSLMNIWGEQLIQEFPKRLIHEN